MDRYAKAIVGALTAGLGAYGAAVADGSTVTGAEWVAISIAAIGALGFVWSVPNATSK